MYLLTFYFFMGLFYLFCSHFFLPPPPRSPRPQKISHTVCHHDICQLYRLSNLCHLLHLCLCCREIWHFHVVVVQRRQRNVQKSVMHVQSCCFANLNLLVYCRSRCRRHRRCLSSLISGGRATKSY